MMTIGAHTDVCAPICFWRLKNASAGAVRGVNPAEAFAKGGDSDEHWGAPSLVSEPNLTQFVIIITIVIGHRGQVTFIPGLFVYPSPKRSDSWYYTA